MKHDPNSKVRSQRENMQAFQLRLPKEVIRELQVLRVFAGVKVSEELRDLVCNWVEAQRPLIQRAAAEAAGELGVELKHPEQFQAAQGLVADGDAAILHATVAGTLNARIDEHGDHVVDYTPTPEEDQETKVYARRKDAAAAPEKGATTPAKQHSDK